MVFEAFIITDKENRVKLFEKTFLMVYVILEVVFGILFLILSGTEVDNFTFNGVRV